MPKFPFTAAHRQQRISAAKQLLAWPVTKVQDIIFCDSAACVVACPKRHKVWISMLDKAARAQVIECPNFKPEHPVHLKWYAALSYRSASPFLVPATGTTSLPKPSPPYKVRPPPAHLQC